jgi:hypothetical protein
MPYSLIRNLFAALVLFAICAGVSLGQTTPSPQLDEQLKGRVKTSLTTWTYLVYAGRSVPNIQVPIDFVQYDERGRLEYEIDFGKDGINRRTTYNRADGKTTIKFQYFDRSGKEIPADRVKFFPNAGLTEQKGLCTEFVVRCEIIAPSNDRLYTEICSDGTIRATELEQFDENDRIIRSVRQDSLKRTWELAQTYDDFGNLISLRSVVNDRERPAFWVSNEYSDFRLDERGRLVGKFASVVNSSFSGVSHQFIENRTIEYYP